MIMSGLEIDDNEKEKKGSKEGGVAESGGSRNR